MARSSARRAGAIDVTARWSDLATLHTLTPADAARAYLALGLSPIALWATLDGHCTCPRGRDCEAPGKHPCHPSWQRAPIDRGSLTAELNRWPRNLGLRTGTQPSGRAMLVVDIDGGRDLYLRASEIVGCTLPRTLTARTSRGWHLIYTAPPGLKNAVRLRAIAGVDARAEGGQIVAAPSVHASGHVYRWTLAMHPVPAPPGIVRALSREEPRPMRRAAPAAALDGDAGARALDTCCRRVRDAPPGTRHDAAFRAAIWIGARISEGMALDIGTATRALTDAARESGLSDPEASRCAASGIAAGMGGRT